MSKSFVMSETQSRNILLRSLNNGERGVRESMSERCFLNRKPYIDKNGNLCIRTVCCENRSNCSKAGKRV